MTNTNFETRDLHEATAVAAALRKLPTLRSDERGRFWFQFLDQKEAKAAAERFWAGDLQVDARSFVRTLRDLKDLLFSRLRREENGDGDDQHARRPRPQRP